MGQRPGELRSKYVTSRRYLVNEASADLDHDHRPGLKSLRRVCAFGLYLAYTTRLRLVYFPDINHLEANVENRIFEVINFDQLSENSLFLA